MYFNVTSDGEIHLSKFTIFSINLTDDHDISHLKPTFEIDC